ncbi:MAG TPA: hypothetical protein VLC11_06485 [Gemmatimonadales bacterium]|nr:hypothetical protein [Gemmatimonadales bacterium]
MIQDPLSFALLLGGAAVVAVLASWLTARLTVRLAARQFQSERWWERKADAYSAVVHALHNMRGYVETLRDVHAGDAAAFPEDQLRIQWRHGREELVRVASQHAFVIADDAAEELTRLHGELRYGTNGRPHAEALAGDADAIGRALTRVRSIAAMDLR